MKKNLSAALFVAVILLLCLVPSVGYLIAGPAQAGANERLSAAPQLREKDGSFNTAFLSETADYFAGRFFLRQELISAHNGLTAALLNTSAEEDVILGQDGWLYYGATLNDYTGLEPMSEAELSAAAWNLGRMQRYCARQGADFLFAIAPNKNSLYPEAMPDYGVRAETGNAQRLMELCESAGVAYLDLFALFGAEEETLYFAHDSHWNSRGAALAADGINGAFGKTSDYFAGDFSATEAHTGDLFEMLYPAGQDRETNPVYGPGFTFGHEGKNTRPDSITINTAGPGEGSLLAFRDSFGNLLYPYLAQSFGHARFSRATAYELTAIAELEADCVLVELVERNLDYLLANLPIMPATTADPDSLPARRTETTPVALKRSEGGKAPEGCVKVEGTLPAAASEVYLRCGETFYELFFQTGDGFAAYIPADAVPGELILIGGDCAAYPVE